MISFQLQFPGKCDFHEWNYLLTIATKAAFIPKILRLEVFKILYRQLANRMLKNSSLHGLKSLD